MHRAILIQCLPCLGALAAACVALALVARLSGARLDWRRFSRLHRCQDGGVQSLAFVLTLPLGIMIMLFIVQVSQLMLAVMTVNYAAYAAARAAVVWTPLETGEVEEFGRPNVHTDYLNGPGEEGRMGIVLTRGGEQAGNSGADDHDVGRFGSEKGYKIGLAAALACVPISPSRTFPGMDPSILNSPGVAAMQKLYRALVPRANERTDRWLQNKVAYALDNTEVFLYYEDKNSYDGLTYNPQIRPPYDSPVGYQLNEIGWEDPITVTVVHHFALLPGPGRFLAARLVRSPNPRPVHERIENRSQLYREPLKTVAVEASVTFTNEGLKSVVPHVHRTY